MSKYRCSTCGGDSMELDMNEFTGEMECARCFFGFAYIPDNFMNDKELDNE